MEPKTEWEELTPSEQKRKLYREQKALLDTFLAHHAISEAQYRKSLEDLTEKMDMHEESDTDIHRRMHDGSLYRSSDPGLLDEQREVMERMYDYNATRPTEREKRAELLKKMFAEIGENCWIEPPFHASWAGKFVRFGKNVYANFNLTLVDDTEITVGNNTMFGPGVTLATAGHPIRADLRAQGYQFNAPIHIGSDCWLGANVTVLPGVSIGDGTVVGAGSVVTKDLPAGVVAVGNPCRVLRAVNEKDRTVYFRNKEIPQELR